MQVFPKHLSHVVLLVNSAIGKVGNIGYRTAYVSDELLSRGINFHGFARGASASYQPHFITLGPLQQLPRVLNAIRIYLFPKFNCRYYDRALFRVVGLRVLRHQLESGARLPGVKVLHLWDYIPEFLKLARNLGYKTVLDVPIAPSKFPTLLVNQGLLSANLKLLAKEEELEHECFSLTDQIIAPSKFISNILNEYNIDSSRVTIVPYGVKLLPANQQPVYSQKRFGLDYIFLGSSNIRKGISYLLEAFSDPRFSKDRLHLCGRVFPEIAKLIRQSRLSNIVLPGFVDSQSYLLKGDVYVHPSLFEGSSKAIYEAMSCGLPVIATYSSGGVFRPEKDGIVVPPGSVSALRDSMLRLKNNPEEREQMGRSAYTFIQDFTWRHYSEQVINVYESI